MTLNTEKIRTEWKKCKTCGDADEMVRTTLTPSQIAELHNALNIAHQTVGLTMRAETLLCALKWIAESKGYRLY